VASAALWTIRILQMLPRSARFGGHLSDCAAHEVFYRKLDPALPPLRVLDVIGFGKKVRMTPSIFGSDRGGIERTIYPHDESRAFAAPRVIYGTKFGEGRAKLVH
jgi:hypothetical protein